jgi:hypothetical protein
MSPALIPVSAEHLESLPEHVRHLFQVVPAPDSEPATTGSQHPLAPPSLFLDSQPAASGFVSESINPSAPDPPVSESVEPPVSVSVDTSVSEPPVSDSSAGLVPASEDAVMQSGDSGEPLFFFGLGFAVPPLLIYMLELSAPPTTPSPAPPSVEEDTPRPAYQPRRIHPEPARRPPGQRKSSWLFHRFPKLIKLSGFGKVEVVLNQVFDSQRNEVPVRSGKFSVI